MAATPVARRGYVRLPGTDWAWYAIIRPMIDLTMNKETLRASVRLAKERNIVVPTFAQMRDPGLIPTETKSSLGEVGLWDLDPLNLFRISWHNEPIAQGGGFGEVNAVE